MIPRQSLAIMASFCDCLKFLTVVGGTVLIAMSPVVTIFLLVNKVEQQSDDHRERMEKISQQRLNLARLAKMDDKELETFAVAAAEEMKKRRKHANHENLLES